MLKSLHLRNFQGHRDSTLTLVPGVNVIAGQSDAGKSSIIRALWWVLRNRPAGAAELFKRHAAGKDEALAVTVELDDAVVQRFRHGSDNGYKVNGESLVAIRSEVPNEVTAALKLEDLNVQPQHAPYFLVADSPGDVAKRLNEVCGLDIIDACLQVVNGKVLANSRDQQAERRQVEELTASKQRYADLAQRTAAVRVAETKLAKRNAIALRHSSLVTLNASFVDERTKLDGLNDFLTLVPTYQKIKEAAARREQCYNRLARLQTLLDDLATLSAELRKATGKAEADRQQFTKRLNEAGVCPVCRQPIHQ